MGLENDPIMREGRSRTEGFAIRMQNWMLDLKLQFFSCGCDLCKYLDILS